MRKIMSPAINEQEIYANIFHLLATPSPNNAESRELTIKIRIKGYGYSARFPEIPHLSKTDIRNNMKSVNAAMTIKTNDPVTMPENIGFFLKNENKRI
jgi:hypothetical protein